MRQVNQIKSIFRIAKNDFRSSIKHQLLVMTIIFFVVAIAILANVTVRSSNGPQAVRAATFGNADYLITPEFENRDQLARKLGLTENDSLNVDVGPILNILNSNGIDYIFRSSVNSRYITYQPWGDAVVESLNIDSPLASPTVASIKGRDASNPNEIAISESLATKLALKVGDTIAFQYLRGAEVVGIVKLAKPDGEVIFAPETDLSKYGVDQLAELRDSDLKSFLAIDEADKDKTQQLLANYAAPADKVQHRFNFVEIENRFLANQSQLIEGGTIFAAVSLLLVAVLAAISFVIQTDKREQHYLRLRAIGANPRHISQIVLTEGALVGLAGAGIAAVFALALSNLWPDVLEQIRTSVLKEDIVITKAQFSSLDFLLPVCLAVSSAAVAAWFPARRAANKDALQTAQVAQKQNPTSGNVKLALLTLGSLTLMGLYATGFNIAGLLFVVLAGLVLVATISMSLSAMTRVKFLFRHFPLLARLNFETALSNRTRAAFTLTPLVLILGIGLIFGIGTNWDTNSDSPGKERDITGQTYASDTKAVIRYWGAPSLLNNKVTIARQTSFDADTYLPPTVDIESTTLVNAHYGDTIGQPAIIIADKELLDLIGSDELKATVEKTNTVISITSGEIESFNDDGRFDTNRNLLNYNSIDLTRNQLLANQFNGQLRYSYFVSETTANNLGLELWPFAQIVSAETGFTSAELSKLRQYGFEVGNFSSNPQTLKPNQTLLALIVSALTLGVMRVLTSFLSRENSDEIRILQSIAAPPSFRRKYLATQALMYLSFAVLLTVIYGAAITTVVRLFTGIDEPPTTSLKQVVELMPLELALAIILVPAIGALITFGTTRNSEVAVSRRIS